MAKNLAAASQAFECLKRTVSSLADSFLTQVGLVEDSKEGASKNAPLSEQFESSQRSQILTGGKRKDLTTISVPITKRQKVLNHSNSQAIVASESLNNWCNVVADQTRFDAEDPAIELNSIFNQLLWTLKYLKFNPYRTNEEMLEMIGTLCGGLENIVALSRLNFSDREFKRFMRIANTLFCLIKSYENENSVLTMVQINNKIDHVFDNFLDRFTEEASAEGHLKSYGFICTLVQQVTDEPMIKKLANKLIFRLYVTATTLWKASISRPSGFVELVDQDDINLFFFYCQLLEVLITATSACQIKLQEAVYESLTALKEDCSSLFILFPNLAMILLSTILVIRIPLKSNALASPLKAINQI